MIHLLERNNKMIPVYLRDKKIECFTFNIIQHDPTTKNNDSDKASLRQKQINVAL